MLQGLVIFWILCIVRYLDIDHSQHSPLRQGYAVFQSRNEKPSDRECSHLIVYIIIVYIYKLWGVKKFRIYNTSAQKDWFEEDNSNDVVDERGIR